MKEEWLFPNAVVPVDVETTAALVAEIHRLIDVVGGLVLKQGRFAELVRADEREVVIKLLIELKVVSAEGTLIDAIRARGNT
jgi:hypothetical protein